MGILQSCGNNDGSMQISLNNKLFESSSSSKYNGNDYYFKQAKIKLFGDILYKKSPQGKTEFILQTNFVNRGTNIVNYALKVYEDSASFIHQKGSKIKIISAIEDPNTIGEKLYVIKIMGKPNQMLLKLVSFNKYEQQKFKHGLYEIVMLHRNLTEQNRFGFVYEDAFVIESGIHKDFNDKCLVIIGDSVTSSLYQIISFRKLSRIPWTETQYERLCYQIIRGVVEIHKNKIAHRQIRPHNIYYSPVKKRFLIAGFHNAIFLQKEDPNIGYSLAGVPYYIPPNLIQIGKKEEYSEYYNYAPYRSDIYALGVTLMNCLFLDQLLPPNILAESLQKYYAKYSFLKLIKSMLDDNPPNLGKVLEELSQGDQSLDERNNIEALRYKMKPQDEEFVSCKKVIANGYYEMFMYDQWVQEINDVVNYYEMNKKYIQLADLYKQIADIYADQNQTQMMQEYYNKASKIFLFISNESLEESKVDEAIKYLQKGIDCNRKGYKGQPNEELAQLLNNLSLLHLQNGQYQYSKTFQQEAVQIKGKIHGSKSSQYAEMLIDSAKIESQFQQFKKAQNMLKAALKIIQMKEQTNQIMRIKAKTLQSIGNNYRMKAMERKDKAESYRKKAEQNLLDALQISERIQGNINPQVGSILLNLGNIYFDKKQFDRAKRSYQKALVVKQHTLKGRDSLQVGKCLTYLGNSQKFLKEYDKSIKHYDEAISVFRKAYGNDHNENTAVALGNLGLVYKELGKKREEKEYLSLAKTILKDLFGQQCADYQYFDRQMSK